MTNLNHPEEKKVNNLLVTKPPIQRTKTKHQSSNTKSH